MPEIQDQMTTLLQRLGETFILKIYIIKCNLFTGASLSKTSTSAMEKHLPHKKGGIKGKVIE